jgi:hypothetical protein
MARTILLWIIGLLACAMAGSVISGYLYGRDGDVLGGAIGALTFAFARFFWLAERTKVH